LPYKFSKYVEKAKLTLFILAQEEKISSEEIDIALHLLNDIINEQIKKIVLENTLNTSKNFFNFSNN
jgi:porphobilinogen deaminase